jgi:putative esterase
MTVEGRMGILKKTVTVLGLSATVFGLVLSGAPVANATEGVVFSDAVGLSKDGSLWLYQNNAIPGWPFSGGSTKIGQGFNKYTNITFADMDGDGRPDIVAYSKNQKAQVFRNNGSATTPFADKPVASDIDHHGGAVFAKLNGKDSPVSHVYVDANGNLMAGKVYLRYKKLEGTYDFVSDEARQIGHGWNNARSIVAGDLNGDGYDDIVAVRQDGTMWAYLNRGRDNKTTMFESGRQIGHGWNGFDTIMLGDMNTDGLADIVGRTKDGRLLQYTNSGNMNWPFGSGSAEVGHGWNGFKSVHLTNMW